jgi:anaerobic dimethyl sulfoxide reductase subunit A
MMPTVPVFCGKDCGGDACPLLAVVENGRVVRVTNNPAGGRYLKGCRRGFDLPRSQYAPDRLLKPLVRVGPRGSGQFRETSWDEALRIVAGKLGEIQAHYGPHAVLNLSSAGDTGALHRTYGQLGRFLSFLGGGSGLTGSYSNAAACFVLPYVLGDDWKVAGHDPATLLDAQMIILWGANVLETRMGAEIPQRLVEARKRGARVVVIDPRRSATVKQASDWWLPVRPGTDAALMLAVLFVLLNEDLADRDFISAHSVGFEQLEAYVTGMQCGQACTPRWAESRCGIPAEEITRFARAYAAARPAMLLPGYSIQRVYAGEEPFRLSVALQVATGNFGLRGGSTGSLNNRLPAPRVGTFPVPNLPGRPTIPINNWQDFVLRGRAGGYPADIHTIYSVGGNMLNQASDVRKSIAAFEKVGFCVSHELFLTPTARYCDVVLPVASPLEKEDIGLPWLGNYLLYKAAALPARGQARSDYEIFCELADRMGFGAEFSEGRNAAQWVQHFMDHSEIPDHAEFRRTGLYLAQDQERVGLADFARDPQARPLKTPSGKVEIASEAYQKETGFPAIPIWREPPVRPGYPLYLITPKSPRYTHSQGSQRSQRSQRSQGSRDWGSSETGVNREKAALEMHPADAAERGIRDGERVRIYNANGAVECEAHLTEDLTPGVVCLLEGTWFVLDESGGLDLAGSPNLLTSSEGSLPSAGGIMHAVKVEVVPARGGFETEQA